MIYFECDEDLYSQTSKVLNDAPTFLIEVMKQGLEQNAFSWNTSIEADFSAWQTIMCMSFDRLNAIVC